MGPGAHQAAALNMSLRKLDLQAAFAVRARAPKKKKI